MIDEIVREIEPRLIQNRRDFHRYAESGWTEFRTASRVARTLDDLGYEVRAGRDILKAEARMGLPEPAVLEAHWQRARAQGGDPEYLEALEGGFPAAVGILRGGEGPTIGLRFDMDAIDLVESQDPDHRPVREGFVSAKNRRLITFADAPAELLDGLAAHHPPEAPEWITPDET